MVGLGLSFKSQGRPKLGAVEAAPLPLPETTGPDTQYPSRHRHYRCSRLRQPLPSPSACPPPPWPQAAPLRLRATREGRRPCASAGPLTQAGAKLRAGRFLRPPETCWEGTGLSHLKLVASCLTKICNLAPPLRGTSFC